MDPITNKIQNYRLWQSGAFGNKLHMWRSVEDWRRSGFMGKVVLRIIQGRGGVCCYNLEPDEVDKKVVEWVSKAYPLDAIMVNEAAPDRDVILQGEYLNGALGDRPPGYFQYSLLAAHMRTALYVKSYHAFGLRSDMLLRGAMTPSSYADWQALLDQYPNHVLEVSIYNRCLGDIPGRNALVWEVRTY
jgi:hypothetical protein